MKQKKFTQKQEMTALAQTLNAVIQEVKFLGNQQHALIKVMQKFPEYKTILAELEAEEQENIAAAKTDIPHDAEPSKDNRSSIMYDEDDIVNVKHGTN